jgi:multidrug efflux pump subunit AcrA (membrane-fusion protein)
LRKTLLLLVAITTIAACNGDDEQTATIQTVPVERRDIVVDAEATGVVEPINVIEVKSKASGQIEQMPVETGSRVKPGDLLVQVDTRDVRNQYNQALADLRAAQARLDVADAQDARRICTGSRSSPRRSRKRRSSTTRTRRHRSRAPMPRSIWRGSGSRTRPSARRSRER